METKINSKGEGLLHTRKESYSSLTKYENCPFSYSLRYIEGRYSKTSTLALELGTLLHYVLEQKHSPYNATGEYLEDLLNEGHFISKGNSENVTGLLELKTKYFDEFYLKGRKSGVDYKEKINNYFLPRLYKTFEEENEENKGWKVLDTEKPFKFVFNGFTIGGKIDRIDTNENGDLRIIDYKSSDASYNDTALNGSLQMYIYALAAYEIYKKVPVDFIYDFILLGETQHALSGNWETRCHKKLTKLIEKVKSSYNEKSFLPKPTPLCYWCEFSNNSVVHDPVCQGVCEYYSLWTPIKKTFAVNKKYGEESNSGVGSGSGKGKVGTKNGSTEKVEAEKPKRFIW